MVAPRLTREQERSLWLHRAGVGALMMDPDGVLRKARVNISRWRSVHRADGMSVRYLDQWSDVIESGVDMVVSTMTGTDERSCELRQNSPFAGVLTDRQRQRALHAFQQHWEQTHDKGHAA